MELWLYGLNLFARIEGVAPENIIFLNFEERENLHLTNWTTLYDEIIEKVNPSDKYNETGPYAGLCAPYLLGKAMLTQIHGKFFLQLFVQSHQEK